MQDYGHIRRMYLVDGLSQRQIAEKLGISRNTVAKYCEGNTYPGLRASYCRAASVMTPDILRFIEQCLHEDRLEPNQKQHHTAKRIYERLVEEKSFTGAQSTVRRIVAKLRGHPREAFVPLAFAPGDAMQIDWSEAVIYLAGERTKVQMFCARLAYSCAPFTVCFRRQQEERQALLPLPGRPYDVRRTEVCRISLQATVRFQGNAYSVPVQYAGQEAALKAGAEDICIYVDGSRACPRLRARDGGFGTGALPAASGKETAQHIAGKTRTAGAESETPASAANPCVFCQGSHGHPAPLRRKRRILLLAKRGAVPGASLA